MSANDFSLAGKRVLVTGASSGIGAACAKDFAEAELIVTGRNAERLEKCVPAGFTGTKIVADLTVPAERAALISAVPAKLDGVVFAAGTNARRPIQAVSEKKLRAIFEVNFFAAAALCRELILAQKIAAGASLVFIASIDGTATAHAANSMYSASKGALAAFARSLANDLAAAGTRVNVICPGAVETPMLHAELSDEQLAADAQNYPLKRFGKPEEIANAARFLLSPASSWTTGTLLTIDGGLTLN